MRRKRSSPAPSGQTAPPSERDTGQGGIALSLLNHFYWIELGIRSYLRSRNNVEFSRAEGLVIASIMLGYTRPSDIARQLGVSRQAIHVTIQQMKKKGIVDLVPDPEDRRIKQVVVTELARRMNDDGIVGMGLLWQELARRLAKEDLTPADLNQAARVLRADWGPPFMFDDQESDLAK